MSDHGDLPRQPSGDACAPVRDAAGTELCGICCTNYSTHDVESSTYIGPVCDDCHAKCVFIPADFSRDSRGIKYGTLGVPLHLRREPTERDFADPRFEIIWELIKRVDVDFRNGLFSGATGNDVCAVLDALDNAESQPVVNAVDPVAQP